MFTFTLVTTESITKVYFILVVDTLVEFVALNFTLFLYKLMGLLNQF